MGNGHIISRDFLITLVQGRVQALSERYHSVFRTALNPVARKRMIGLFFVLLALILGFKAEKLSRSLALDEWLGTHAPNEQTWMHALGARAFSKVTEETVLNKATMTMPTDLIKKGAVLIDATRKWIAVHDINSDEKSA